MKKRMLSILLCLCLCVGMLPVAALADPETEDLTKIGEYGLDDYGPSMLDIVRDTTINPDGTVSVTFRLKEELEASMGTWICLRFRYDTAKMELKECSTEGVFGAYEVEKPEFVDHIPYSVFVECLGDYYPAGNICTLTFSVKDRGDTNIFGAPKPYWWVDLGGEYYGGGGNPVTAFLPDYLSFNFCKVTLYEGLKGEEENKYTVTYDLDGGAGVEGVTYPDETVPAGTEVTVKPAPGKDNYTFTGWSDGTTIHQPGGKITVNSNITLTAQWKKADKPIDPDPPIDLPLGDVKLTKVDADDDSTILPGVVFELYRSTGRLVGTYTTNKNGEIRVSDLLAGDYYWKEVRSAEGYVLDDTEHSFTVSAWRTTSLVIENEKSGVPDVFTDDHYAYIIGSDGLVRPEANITRAEVATIFFRLLNEETRAAYLTDENTFTDVNEGDWFNTAASTMAAMGIVTGRPGGIFDPDANITRAEFAAITARFDANGDTTGASFTDIYGHWAEDEINIAANNGWILGSGGKFRPDDLITRAEAMTMVNRVLQRIPENEEDLHLNMILWPDNRDTSKWYYLMVQEATNSHDYVRKENGYECWISLRETPDWAALEQISDGR